MKIKKIAKEIIEIEFNKTDTLQDCTNKFYEIMRKYGIKQGTKVIKKGVVIGRTCNNYEWTLFLSLFLSQFNESLYSSYIFTEVPDDLQC